MGMAHFTYVLLSGRDNVGAGGGEGTRGKGRVGRSRLLKREHSAISLLAGGIRRFKNSVFDSSNNPILHDEPLSKLVECRLHLIMRHSGEVTHLR